VEVLEPAVILVCVRGYPGANGFAQRASHRAHVVAVETLSSPLKRGAKGHFQSVSGFLRVDEYRAPGHVTPEKRSLRTSKHLDALDIKRVEQGAADVGPEIHAVDEHSHGRVNGRYGTVYPESANGKVGDSSNGADVVKRDVGHLYSETFKVPYLKGVNLFGAEMRYRERNVLNRLFPFPRRDCDLLKQDAAYAECVLGVCRDAAYKSKNRAHSESA